MDDLIREDAASLVKEDELIDFTDLWKQAEEKLGYKVAKKSARQSKLKASLLSALEKADVRPFTGESVEKYKQQIESFPIVVPMVMTLATILCYVGSYWVLGVCSFWGSGVLGVGLLLWSLVMTMGTVGSWVEFGEGQSSNRWGRFFLENYTKPVPEFAIQTALDIRKHFRPVGKLRVWVEEAVEIPDPFLIVGAEGLDEVFYIEVWNEPSFRGERAEAGTAMQAREGES
jgi:hypothetical protein